MVKLTAVIVNAAVTMNKKVDFAHKLGQHTYYGGKIRIWSRSVTGKLNLNMYVIIHVPATFASCI